MDEQWVATNRALWDERVPIHVASDFYGVDGFLAGNSMLRPFEVEELGPVDGATLGHPQCHFGLDTLSWARRGASVLDLPHAGRKAVAAADVLDSGGRA